MGIPFPEEYGGGGADTLSYALAIEELARIDSSVCITMAAHTSLGTMPIYLWGTDEQKRDWLPQLCGGRAARRLRPDRAGGRLGRRQHPHPRRARRRRVGDQRRQAVHHQLRHRHLRLRDDHGGHRRGRTGARRSPTSSSRTARPATRSASPTGRWAGTPPTRGRSTFDDCRVPEANLLGRRGDGFKQFLHILDGGRIGVAAMGVGLAQGALDEALAYAKERRAFGQPISKFQAIQAKIADISSEIEAARLLTYKAAHREGPRRELHAHRRPGEAEDRPARRPRLRGGRPDPRRLRLHRGVPGLPLLPRRQDPHDRRGHRRGAADGDRAPAGARRPRMPLTSGRGARRRRPEWRPLVPGPG